MTCVAERARRERREREKEREERTEGGEREGGGAEGGKWMERGEREGMTREKYYVCG